MVTPLAKGELLIFSIYFFSFSLRSRISRIIGDSPGTGGGVGATGGVADATDGVAGGGRTKGDLPFLLLGVRMGRKVVLRMSSGLSDKGGRLGVVGGKYGRGGTLGLGPGVGLALAFALGVLTTLTNFRMIFSATRVDMSLSSLSSSSFPPPEVPEETDRNRFLL